VGKIFKTIWVGLRVGKVRSVFFQGTAKLSVVFWSFVGGCVRRLTLAGNVFGLCVRAGFGAQNCQPALNLNRSTKLQVCTSLRLTQNPCYGSFFLSSANVFVCFVYQIFCFFKVLKVFNCQLKVTCSKVSNFSNVTSLTWHWFYFVWIKF